MTQHIKISAGLISELADRRRHGQVGPLTSQRASSLIDAFASQQAVVTMLDSPVIGWKCGMPSAERWVLAPLLQHEFQQGDDCQIWPSASGMARVEPELCFVLKHPLPARALPYSPQDVDQAIGTVHLALELIQSRYATEAGATFLDQLADGLFNQGLWLGPAIKAPEASEFLITLTTDALGQTSTFAGKHPNLAPRLPLYWLVNFLSAHQIDLPAGQHLITGSFAGVLELPMDTPVQLQYGDLGEIALQFRPRRPW